MNLNKFDILMQRKDNISSNDGRIYTMHEIKFIQDLAIIMSLAGLVTILFHRFKQPIVLGYILVGVIIGPHTPPFTFISDEESIRIFSELGVIFLMFSLGLEFSLQKLMKVGPPALVAAILEILVMIFVGYKIGKFFNWQDIDALFLGGMLAISSTTIIVKALNDLDVTKKHFAQLIFGVLVIEDILAIAILVLLTSIGTSNSISTMNVAITLGKLLLFLIVSLCIGILTIPRFLAYVAKFQRQEILLIAILGLCFGFCLLVVKLHYSIVLGAFIIGAIIAESRQIKEIAHLIEPLRDMFSAIFFVAIGLMLDPKILIAYTTPILIITIAVIIGKVISCGFGMFITGQGAKTGLRVGMGLAQIGEFSFIIAALGLSLNVTAKFLYPIAVAVSALTTLSTPYLIKFSDPLADYLKKTLPKPLAHSIENYTDRRQKSRIKKQNSEINQIVKRALLNIFLNLSLVIALFLSIPYIENTLLEFVPYIKNIQLSKAIILSGTLALALPFLIAIYGKLVALSVVLIELRTKNAAEQALIVRYKKIIRGIIPNFLISIITLCLIKLSYSFLPSIKSLIIIAIIILMPAIFLRTWFIKLHLHLQTSFTQILKKTPKGDC